VKTQAQAEPGAQQIHIAELRPGYSPRLNGEVGEHVQALAAPHTPFPPILVHRDTMQVIDGMHRLRAAGLRGQKTIGVKFFDGTEADAFVLAVQANIAHGLPLRLADREAAAARIIKSHPRHSDRWIAKMAGLAVGTVAAIRRGVGGESVEAVTRVGQDGRVRPLDGAERRRKASQAIAEHPAASLREIARIAGISPGTVRDVRNRLQRGEDPVRPAKARKDRADNAQSGDPPRLQDRSLLLGNLQRDPALRYSESGRAILLWLNSALKGASEYRDLIITVPEHNITTIMQLTRQCAADWLEVTTELEHRARQISARA
jgi:DNA-binding CsgD family transcriptional regulator